MYEVIFFCTLLIHLLVLDAVLMTLALAALWLATRAGESLRRLCLRANRCTAGTGLGLGKDRKASAGGDPAQPPYAAGSEFLSFRRQVAPRRAHRTADRILRFHAQVVHLAAAPPAHRLQFCGAGGDGPGDPGPGLSSPVALLSLRYRRVGSPAELNCNRINAAGRSLEP